MKTDDFKQPKSVKDKPEVWKKKLEDNVSKGYIKEMKFKTIGLGNINIPTHLFKIISCENPKNKETFLACFVVPNRAITNDKTVFLTDFEVEIEEVEKLTGLEFVGINNMKNKRSLM